MKVRVLTSAIEDLFAGRVFYEKQGEGLGSYFFDSVFSSSFTDVAFNISQSFLTSVERQC